VVRGEEGTGIGEGRKGLPGVWAVLVSSWSPGITRTPVVFQPSSGVGAGFESAILNR
jgi:hypothetical protein